MDSREARDTQIGGGRVLRAFQCGTRMWRPGEEMTSDEIYAIAENNRSALIGNRYISVWPAPPPGTASRRIVQEEDGTFSVIEGVVLNKVPMDLKEATDLARNSRRGRVLATKKAADGARQARAG